MIKYLLKYLIIYMKLTKKDYLTILKFYKLEVSHDTSFKEIKDQAENIINKKLCKCIKNIQKKENEKGEVIGICKKSVLNNKGIYTSNFSCKKNSTFGINKKTKKSIKNKLSKLYKTHKTRKTRKTRKK